MGTKNVILITVVVLVGAATAWRLTRADPDSLPPDTPESVTHWICEKCGEVFHLTAKDVADWQASRVRHGSEYDPKQAVYRCDTCNEYTVIRAFKCKKHGSWYYERSADGTPTDCPECIAEGGG